MKTTKSNLKAYFILFLTALYLILVTNVMRITGTSMEPTLKDNSYYITNKFDRNFKKGDIVTITTKEHDRIVKRIIGVAGDKITYTGEGYIYTIYNNGEKIAETSLIGEEEMINLTVPKGYVYVMGDNFDNSLDSRYYGPIPLKSIDFKATTRYIPNFLWWGMVISLFIYLTIQLFKEVPNENSGNYSRLVK